MRYQSTPSRCGPAAIVNALQALNVFRSEDEVATLAGSNANGTSAEGILKSLKQIASATNHPMPGAVYEAREDVAALKIVEALRCKRPVIG